MTTGPANKRTVPVRYLGHAYDLVGGRALDWQRQPMLFHRQGCPLCCDVRVTTGPGQRPSHPENCPQCGPAWDGRRPDPCAYCGRVAHFRDASGRPVHKTCLETALVEVLRRGADTVAA